MGSTRQPGPPDRTSLRAGLGGLVLVALAALPWAALAAALLGGPAHPTWAVALRAAVSVVGFCLGVLAVWSAIKAWLRDDYLSPPARWGMALGLAEMVVVVVLGPCGPQSCPG
jgi:hypothetical protein